MELELRDSVVKALRLAGFPSGGRIPGGIAGARSGGVAGASGGALGADGVVAESVLWRRGFYVKAVDAQTVAVSWVGERTPLRQVEEEHRLRETLRLFGYTVGTATQPGVAFIVRGPVAGGSRRAG
jgi:hypothetical protein